MMAETRDWVFTFGADHMLTIRPGPGETDAGSGASLAGRYVLVQAPDETTAREAFVRVFGPGRFAGVYPAPRGTGPPAPVVTGGRTLLVVLRAQGRVA